MQILIPSPSTYSFLDIPLGETIIDMAIGLDLQLGPSECDLLDNLYVVDRTTCQQGLMAAVDK